MSSCWLPSHRPQRLPARFQLPGFLLKCFNASVLRLSGTGEGREKWQKSYIKSLSFQESDFLPFFQENKDLWQRLQRCWPLIPLSHHSDGLLCWPQRQPCVALWNSAGIVECPFIVDVRNLASCPSLTTSSQCLEL